MRTQQCAVFDPDHYNIIDITNYEKYRQHIEQQREMEIQKEKARRKREIERHKYIAQKIFCVMLMIVGYLLCLAVSSASCSSVNCKVITCFWNSTVSSAKLPNGLIPLLIRIVAASGTIST